MSSVGSKARSRENAHSNVKTELHLLEVADAFSGLISAHLSPSLERRLGWELLLSYAALFPEAAPR